MVVTRKLDRRKNSIFKKTIPKKDKRKEMILRAVVDPKFRKKLLENPEQVFGVKELSREDKQSVRLLRKTLPGMDGVINGISDSLLCGTGGCGGLA